MTEEHYLDFVREALTPSMRRIIDVTPGRQPSPTLESFFAWDETLGLITALHGFRHRRTAEQVVFNCGLGAYSTNFSVVQRFQDPPYNMVSPDQVWEKF